jgi:hypothetical protein
MSNVLRYGSAKLFASDSAQPNTLKALSLVNEINFGFDANRENIKSIGSQKTFKTFLEPPKPTVSFKYFISDLDNEKFFTMPTTSFQAYTLRTPIFTGLKPFDLAFVLDKKGRDFDKISVYDEVSVCLMTNCVLTNYSFSVNKNAVTQVSVQFQGDNIIFKNFKNILDYDDLIYDSTDLQMTNRLDFQINDGTQEIVENIGGAKTQSRVNYFEFSAEIPYKKLYDFGQLYHKKEINYPITTSISVSAIISEFIQGQIQDMFCNDQTNDFILIHSRLECNKKENFKSGMVFKNARLTSQNYSLNTSSFLNSNLNFELEIDRNCGAYFSQHVSAQETLVHESYEDASSPFKNFILEDGSNSKILTEVILDMIASLKDFRANGACGV